MKFDTDAGFEDFLGALPRRDEAGAAAAASRQKQLTKPPGSLGRLEDIAAFLAAWQGPAIRARHIQVALFAGSHGVTRQGISPYPAEVTGQMVANFNAGGAAINQLASAFDLSLSVHALALDRPTGDISAEPAMSGEDCLAALNQGAAAVDSNADLLAVGEMGIGNTTVAAALCAGALGASGLDWAGAGTGLDPAGVRHKAMIVDRAGARLGPGPHPALQVYRQLGGRELVAIAGAVCAARHYRIPVLLDGFVACAAMAPLFAQQPCILDHCLAGHRSAEQAHGRLLQQFGLKPLLELEMRLGEGSGAAVAAAIVRAAVATHNGMATFADSGVTDRPA